MQITLLSYAVAVVSLGMGASETTRSPNSLAVEVARCLRCSKGAFLALRAAFVSGNNFERFINVCDRIRGMLDCTKRIRGKCANALEVQALMESFQYLCQDQFQAYKHVMECMDTHSGVVSRSCEILCHADRYMLGWFFYGFMRSSLLLSIPEGEMPSKVNVLYFRKVTAETCTILVCYIACMRERYNAKCGGIGGSMLLEALFRPMMSLHKSWAYSPIANTMKLILPPQCNIVATEQGINYYRLGKQAEESIKQSFTQGSSNDYSNLLKGRNLSVSIPQIPLLRGAISPLDQSHYVNNPVSTPAVMSVEPDEARMHLAEVEEQIEELKKDDERQRAALDAFRG